MEDEKYLFERIIKCCVLLYCSQLPFCWPWKNQFYTPPPSRLLVTPVSSRWLQIWNCFFFLQTPCQTLIRLPRFIVRQGCKIKQTASYSSSDKTARDKGVANSPTSLLTETSKQTIKLQLPRRHYENSAFLTCKLRLSPSTSIETERANPHTTSALCRLLYELTHAQEELCCILPPQHIRQ